MVAPVQPRPRTTSTSPSEMNAMSKRALNLSRTALGSLAIASLILSSGCSLYRAKKAFEAGHFEESARAYHDIIDKDPKNLEARIGYKRASLRASEEHLEAARKAQERGQTELVEREVRRAYQLDPSNSKAQDWIAHIELAARKKAKEAEDEESLEEVRERAGNKPALMLNPRSLEGMELNFSRKTSLKDIFAALSKASGVSIITHNSFQDTQITADLRGLTFQRILDTLMLQSDLFYKVLDTNTIMVFKKTSQNILDYDNQLIQTFFLSNADLNELRQAFQTLMPQIKVVADKRTNALTVKARPYEITIAKRIVSQLDKAKAEVMVYMELLEVTENNLEQVGLMPVLNASDGMGGGSGVYRLGAMLDTQDSSGLNQSKGSLSFNKSDVRFLFPSLALDALQANGDAKLVASPNVRVMSGEKADVKIGEKISTTQSSIANLGGMSGSTSGSSSTSSLSSSMIGQTQYNYEDVGVTITVEPRVHFNDDVTLTLKSKITTLKSGSTPGRPDMGQREVNTVCRLRDGETAVFGGLLKEEEQKSLQGIWGLTDVPVIGKLLGNNYKKKAKTDVILTIRAVLVRKPDLTESDFEAFDPDMATSQAGPFTPKKPKTPKPQDAEAAPATTETAPTAPGAQPQSTPTAPKANPAATTEATATPTAATQPQAAASATQAQPAEAQQDLVLFFTPLTSTLKTGEHQLLTLMASGGKGLSSGSIELKVDSRLKVIAANPGDFLTNDGGTLDQAMNKAGIATLKFKRNSTATDSGALAVIEVEALQPGNAPILVQTENSRFLVGNNPIPGKAVNALVTVE